MKKNILVILFLTVYFFALGYKIIHQPTPFYDWDESLYVQTGKEMIEQNKFLMPVWQGNYWLDKPPLIPLIYGAIARLSFSIPPEISTRILSLIIAITVLVLVYVFYQRVIKNAWLSTLVTAIIAFTPLFLQRAQTVNLDIFVLLGWLGYMVFFDSFLGGLFFLFICVMSKSLIGFYPVAITGSFYLWQFLTKKIRRDELGKILKKMAIQSAIMFTWFILMILVFGKQFWVQHIIESHFRRVTSSIEFHFGERIFYITQAIDQMGYFFWLSIIGGIIVFLKLLKNKFSEKDALIGFYLLPWFIFLNLTKTKIFWYFLPAIPQFAFLAVFWIKQIKIKPIMVFFGLSLLIILLYQSFVKQNVLATTYSKPESYYYLSLYAKDRCPSLNVLMDNKSRESFATLEKMGLLITTTKWWGNHPSMVYYFGKRINFYYEKTNFDNLFHDRKGCFVVEKNDLSNYSVKDKQLSVKQYEDYFLIKK
ncbi:hypothetical protein GYA28_02995 [Candidatus Roizmanbacteria bacterium]|nr:hypothetical protein [Candidatus Roizmanbacteria bacterium]